MLTPHADKMLRPAATKRLAPPPPDAARGRCPGCGAVGPLVVDRRHGKPRPAVLCCRCLTPPLPTPERW